ncbi:MAG: EAL domain-containing protein, partial [Gammaproteobacteria bacterium]|nr:EAL domain-containing protein [Gammaproteobacteria bacterium]
LHSLQEELDARSRELATFSERVNELTAEIASLKTAGEQQEASHREEAERLGHEIRQLNESLNEQESQFRQREEELLAYTDKIQSLNRTLHESAISENDMHARALEDKDREIASLHGRLATATDMQSAGDETAQMQSALQELESRFRESEDRCQVLGERASAADELEAEVARLSTSLQAASEPGDEAERLNSALQEAERLGAEVERLNSALQEAGKPGEETERLEEALQEVDRLKTETEQLNAALVEARNTATQDAANSGAVETLRQQVADLESALEATRAERDVLGEKLDNFTAQEEEIPVLTQAVEQSGDNAHIQALTNEIEILKSALAAAEEKCESLEASQDIESSPVDAEPATTATPMSLEPVEQHVETTDRDGFLTLLNRQLDESDEGRKSSTVMYVLVDNFVRVRDEIGIMNSEKVMTEIAGIISSSCNGSIVARFGDCTFAVLSNDENQDETRDKAEKIRTTLETHIFEVLGQSLVTTASIGICSIRDNDNDAEKVVSRADVACESARTSGGNQIVVSSAVADDINVQGNHDGHAEIVSNILSDNRIKIYYQPISSLVNKESHCYEVLTRIVDEDGNIILPGEFFSMAINSGKAMEVDLHIIENIMRMMSNNSGQPMTLFLKLTKQTIASQDFAVWLMEKIREHQINPEQLVFEVAENLLQNELKSLSMLSKALASIGCKMAIEHYRMDTQPQHLQHIQADYLKIDSGLVQNIGNKGKCFTKVTDIVEVARNNNF